LNEGGDECEVSLCFGLLVLQAFKIGCSVKTYKVSIIDYCKLRVIIQNAVDNLIMCYNIPTYNLKVNCHK